MSKKPIDKDKIIVRACYIGMAAIVIMIAGLFITYDIWSPKFREEWYGRPMDVTVTPTAAGVPEETAAPTLTEIPTELPAAPTESAETAAPTEPVVTEAPAETVAPEVTEEPEVTVIPDGTENEEPVLTSAPTPSPMPTATSTPVPTNTPDTIPTVTEGNGLKFRCQMGDNVWYEYYEDGLLLVTGTGSTWDFGKNSEHGSMREQQYQGEDKAVVDSMINAVKEITIAEGITGIGDYALGVYENVNKIVIPSTLKEVGAYGLRSVGEDADTTEWIGLDLSKINAHEEAFLWANGLESMDTSSLIIQLTPTPTPLPPTPTPIPDPDNPRLIHTQSMGNKVEYEFWDTGYIYAEGSGKIKDLPDMYMWPQLPEGTLSIMDYYIAAEGITELGNWCIPAAVNEIWLPKSLQSIDEYTNNYIGRGMTLHWYYEGKAVTITTNDWSVELSYVYDCLVGEKSPEEYALEIVWE